MATIPTMVGRVIDRLNEAARRESLSVVDLRSLLGGSYQAAKKVFDGGGIKFETAVRAAKLLNCDPQWLMTGKHADQTSFLTEKLSVAEPMERANYLPKYKQPDEQEMVPLDEVHLRIIERLENEEIEQGQQVTRIPEYGTGGRMGASGVLLRDQPGEIRGWDVTREWLRKNVPNCTAPGNLAIVTGFGDSMRPLYNPGDPLLVDTGVRSVAFDAIYFFRVGDEGFIKRLQRIPGNGLLAISENSSYRDWTITPEMDFEVFGRVIKVWRGDDF